MRNSRHRTLDDAVTAFLLLPMKPGTSSGPKARDALVALPFLRLVRKHTEVQKSLAGV